MHVYRIEFKTKAAPDMDKTSLMLVKDKTETEDASRHAVRIDSVGRGFDGDWNCHADCSFAGEFGKPDRVELQDADGSTHQPVSWSWEKIKEGESADQ